MRGVAILLVLCVGMAVGRADEAGRRPLPAVWTL